MICAGTLPENRSQRKPGRAKCAVLNLRMIPACASDSKLPIGSIFILAGGSGLFARFNAFDDSIVLRREFALDLDLFAFYHARASSVCSDGGVRRFREGGADFRDASVDLSIACVARNSSPQWDIRQQIGLERQQIAGHSAEDPFVEPVVAVSPGHQQIGPFVLGQPDDLIRTRPMRLYFDPTFGLYPVLRQIANDVIDVMSRDVHLILPAYLHDGYAFRLVKERQRVLNGSPRLPRILPSNHDMVSGQGISRLPAPPGKDVRLPE